MTKKVLKYHKIFKNIKFGSNYIIPKAAYEGVIEKIRISTTSGYCNIKLRINNNNLIPFVNLKEKPRTFEIKDNNKFRKNDNVNFNIAKMIDCDGLQIEMNCVYEI